MEKDKFLSLFDQDVKYVAVKIEKEEYKAPEIIITFRKNFSKMKKFYDENYEVQPRGLKHKFAKIPIFITDATVLNDLEDIEYLLSIK